MGGIIPDSFGQLTKLSFFGVDANNLVGIVPPSLFNLSSLRLFDVGVNQIQGNLPWDIGITLSNIEIFSIAMNQFPGSIPISISNASNLDQLQLSENKLSGKVTSFEKLNRISFFSISSNNLGNGWADDLNFLCSLRNATYLTFLTIDSNNFGGRVVRVHWKLINSSYQTTSI